MRACGALIAAECALSAFGLQGDAVLLEEGVSLKSGDYNHEPLIGFVNVRALGESR